MKKHTCLVAALVAQTVKTLPAMWEIWVQSLRWGDPLEERMATHSSILAWRISMDEGAWWATVCGVAKSQTWLSNLAQQRCWEGDGRGRSSSCPGCVSSWHCQLAWPCLGPASVGPSLGHLSPPRWPHGARWTAHIPETQRDSVLQMPLLQHSTYLTCSSLPLLQLLTTWLSRSLPLDLRWGVD